MIQVTNLPGIVQPPRAGTLSAFRALTTRGGMDGVPTWTPGPAMVPRKNPVSRRAHPIISQGPETRRLLIRHVLQHDEPLIMDLGTRMESRMHVPIPFFLVASACVYLFVTL